MDIAQRQADVPEDTSQNRFIDVSLNGASDHDLPVRHSLVSKKRELLSLRGTCVRKQSLWERHSALNKGPCLTNAGCCLDSRPFSVRLEEQDLIEPNAFIAK